MSSSRMSTWGLEKWPGLRRSFPPSMVRLNFPPRCGRGLNRHHSFHRLFLEKVMVAGKPTEMGGIDNYPRMASQGIFFALDHFINNDKILEQINMTKGLEQKTFIIQVECLVFGATVPIFFSRGWASSEALWPSFWKTVAPSVLGSRSTTATCTTPRAWISRLRVNTLDFVLLLGFRA
jgi:hypothetical protein